MDAVERTIRERLAMAGSEMSAYPLRPERTLWPARHRTLRPLLAAAALTAVIGAVGGGFGLHSRLTGHRPAPAATPTPGLPTPAPTAQPTTIAVPAPSNMNGAQAVWDSTHQELLLVDTSSSKGSSPSMWTWNGMWKERNPASSPDTGWPGRVVDMPPLHGVVWLTGGSGNSNGADLWNGSTWKSLPAPGYPSNFIPVAAAYDEQRHQAVVIAGPLVGGCGACGSPEPPQTWTWDGRTWAHRGDPPASFTDATAGWDPGTRSVVLAADGPDGGQSWRWTGSAWTSLGRGGALSVMVSGMAYDSTAGALVVYSDSGKTVFLRNGTWQEASSATYSEQLVAVVADTTHRRALLVGLSPISINQTPMPYDDSNSDVVMGWTGTEWAELSGGQVVGAGGAAAP
jgi:hypothetical protein